ncbi:peptidoglycan-binding domain-containing protein [Nakamurella sp. GG22]
MPVPIRQHRIATLIAAIAVAVAGHVAVPSGASAAQQAAALPVVNMDAVLKAAQWDPQKAGSGITRGSGPSVLLVEKALNAKGLLNGAYVDGHYGTSTVTACTRWQRQLGYSGLGANGIPGETSLKKLATNRFTVTAVVRPGARVLFDGQTVDARTAAMLTEAASILGTSLRLDQGSYSTSDPTSAGTHAGGGAVDVNVDGWSAARRRTVAGVLRSVGFAAWVRSPTEGDWPWHIHAVAISDPDLAPEAQAQVGDYYLGRNGLKNNGPDTGPAGPKVTWEEYLRQQ